MAGKIRYSELPAADALDGDEILVVTQDGESVRTTTQQVADLAPGGGGGGDITYYERVVNTPTTVVLVQHNRGYKPGGVTAIHDDGTEWDGITSYSSDNALVYTFLNPFTGTIYVS